MSETNGSANGNGHPASNGSTAKPPVSGVGGSLQQILTNPNHAASDMRMIERALREGWITSWKADPVLREELPKKVAESIERSAKKQDERSLLRGVEVIMAMQRDNLSIVESVDKSRRLDSGDDTERIGCTVLTDDERSRAMRLVQLRRHGMNGIADGG